MLCILIIVSPPLPTSFFETISCILYCLNTLGSRVIPDTINLLCITVLRKILTSSHFSTAQHLVPPFYCFWTEFFSFHTQMMSHGTGLCWHNSVFRVSPVFFLSQMAEISRTLRWNDTVWCVACLHVQICVSLCVCMSSEKHDISTVSQF